MLDYHLHLLGHGDRRPLHPDDVRDYAQRAGTAGLAEIAITEHFFRFAEGQAVVGRWWDADPDPRLQAQTEAYLGGELIDTPLDEYVAIVREAAADPAEGAATVRLGLEVDYYPDRMGDVAEFLDAYPFDVLLGSVHWLGAWGFDQFDDPLVAATWERNDAGSVWERYVDAVDAMAASGACDVLAHVDLAKVTGVHPPDDAAAHGRLAKAAAAHGVCVEVSSAGWRKPVGEAYPAVPLLAALHEAGVGITLASDAHDATTVADRIGDTAALARSVGFTQVTAFERRAPRLLELPAPFAAGEGA